MSLYNLQEYVYPDARDRQYLLFFHKGVKRTRFDIEKYNKLKDDVAEVRVLGDSCVFCDVKTNSAVEPGSYTSYISLLGFVTNRSVHIFTPPPSLSLQVELDLKRLRDPLQLQLPVQQLTTDKN